MANKKVSAAKKRYAELKKKEQEERASSEQAATPEPESEIPTETDLAEPAAAQSPETTTATGTTEAMEDLKLEPEAVEQLEQNPVKEEKLAETEDSEADAFDAAISGTNTPAEPEVVESQPKEATGALEPVEAPKPAEEAPAKAAKLATPPPNAIFELEEELISVQEENDTLKARIVLLENKVSSLEAQLSAARTGSNEDELAFSPPPGASRPVPDLYSESETVTQIRQSMGKFKDFNLDMRTWQYMSGIGPIISI